MGNLTNTEGTQFKSGDIAVENGRKGGIASGKSKRRKKEIKECIEILLESEITTNKGEKMTGAEALATKLFERALKGNVRAFEVLRDTAGQKPIERIQVAEVDQNTIEEIEAMFNGL